MRLITKIGIVGSSIFSFMAFVKYGFISLDTSELIGLTGLGLVFIYAFWSFDKIRDFKAEIKDLWDYTDHQQKLIDKLEYNSKTETGGMRENL